ncbi:MAG: 2-C-methyl-D-erythritol 4-phosphate cytidylyltransferase [Cryomorphaceae bacterium]|nr:MAG: 2-C-methyl-D-erythritol 4-phosphate cytidylyltransferase [Cryomorphaceae bacterium]
MPGKAVIIVAGGSGTRMGCDRPKQFLTLAGEPVLLHTLRAFAEYDPNIQLIVVLPHNHISEWEAMYANCEHDIPHTLTTGGEQRFHSVKNGLALVNEAALVAVHDGVRPFVDAATIERAFTAAEQYGAAVPVLPVDDTLREVYGSESRWVDRSRFVRIQTPQCFKTSLLKRAYEQDYSATFTDDASVVEQLGERVELVEGNVENFKITVPFHLHVAETVLAAR